jgi:peptidoglycan/xylan/chitin deacetylase (PgdA/CDA1 family)
MYHRFAFRPENRRLAAAIFDEQVRYIRRQFEPRRLDELTAQLRRGQRLRRPAVAITVDDGYFDFYEVAYPILKRHGVPATVFVVTRFADQAIWLWFDALHYMVHRAKPGRYRVDVAGSRIDLRVGDDRDRAVAWETIADTCAALTPRARDSVVRSVEAALDVQLPSSPTERYRAMTWDELRRLDPTLIEVGGHSRTHPILSQCTPSEVDFEVTDSKAAIERELGRHVGSFCYPSGRPQDYTDSVAAAVRRARYDCAVVAHGTLIRHGADLFALERVGASDNVEIFRNAVDGLPHLYERAKRRLRPADGTR